MLTPPEYELFQRMPVNDQRHSLAVMRALRQAGHTSPDLLAAALLHDVGKTRVRLHLWERAMPVLGRAFAPGLSKRLAAGSLTIWSRPFVTAAQHPVWGAEMVAAAGGSPRTVALIRRHAEPARSGRSYREEEDRLLRALQQADNEN